ncbi:MAG: hypothetical protein WC523_00765 [Patescibacteria group bacterium]
MSLLKKLVKLANELDEKGLFGAADEADALAKREILEELKNIREHIDEAWLWMDSDDRWRLRLRNLMDHRDDIIARLKKLNAPALQTESKMSLLKQLVKLANELDEKGLFDEADEVDSLVKTETLEEELKRVKEDIEECLPQADYDGGWRLRLHSLINHRDSIIDKLKALNTPTFEADDSPKRREPTPKPATIPPLTIGPAPVVEYPPKVEKKV